jgi:DNA-binding response OmpR family regulator
MTFIVAKEALSRVVSVGSNAPALDAVLLALEPATVERCACEQAAVRWLSKHAAELVVVWVDAASFGVRSCARLRRAGVGLPLLCVSPGADAAVEAELVAAGADAVADAADAESVSVLAESLIRLARREYRLELGTGVAFDCTRRAVLAGGAETALAPAPFELFRALALDFDDWVPIESVLRSLSLHLGGESARSLVRKRAHALQKALIGSGLGVSYSASAGVRLSRAA